MKTVRALKVLTLAALSLVLVFSFVSCGDLEVEKFTPVRDSVKTIYLEGEAVDFSGIKVQIQYNDSDLDAELTLADGLTLEYDENITATAGNKQLKIVYKCPHTGTTQGAILPILVEVDPDAVKHDSYVLDTTEMKTSYVLGETVDFTGLKVIEKFTNGGADVEMTDLSLISYTYDAATITATEGNKQITVTYNGEAAGVITISVNPPEKNAIEKILIQGNYNTRFEKGTNPDFTGMSLKVTYKEGNIVTVDLAKLTFSVNMNSVGRQTVTVSFTDEINNERAETTFTIEVYEKKTVLGFEPSDEITEFKTSNDHAGVKNYGDVGFESQYENKAVYLIGDDNEFTFYPKFTVMDGTMPTILKNGFYSKVTLSVKLGGVYKTLEAKVEDATKPSFVSYYDGETLYATVNTYYGRYEFAAAAKDKEVKISVLPDEAHYKVTDAINPVTLEAKVVDGYNVTEAWQLAVVDNTQSYWNAHKTEKGIVGVNPAAVILHKDIKLTAADIPADFLLTLDRDIVYTNDTTKETKTVKAGTKYIRDWSCVYVHSGENDFAFEGNFFTLDLSEFPLAPSPAVFGADLGYGSDFSNMTLFYFQHDTVQWDKAPAKAPAIVMENFSLRGNAGIDKWVDAEEHLVSAGGVIFMKAADHSNATVRNANITSCFISFFSDLDACLTIDTVKAYDSYQNVLYIWGNRECDVKNSYFVRAGGPMVIVQSIYRENNTVVRPATLNITDTVIESGLTGQEIWFSAVQATPLVTQKITPLLNGLEQAGIGQFMTADGKMNVVAAMISDTGNGFSDLNAVVGNGAMTGTVLVNGGGLDRQYTDPLWSQILAHSKFGQGAAFLTVGTGADAVILYHDGEKMCDYAGNEFGTLPEHLAMGQAFGAADHFVLSQGGLTVVFARAE